MDLSIYGEKVNLSIISDGTDMLLYSLVRTVFKLMKLFSTCKNSAERHFADMLSADKLEIFISPTAPEVLKNYVL